MKRKAWYVPLKKVNNNYVIPDDLLSIKPAFCDIESNEFEGIEEENLQIREGQAFKVELLNLLKKLN